MTARTILTATGLVTVAVGSAIALLLGGQGAGATSRTVTAVTHASNHPDTTSVAGDATVASPGGPVWAYDNLAVRFAVTPNSDGTYSVVITDQGSFAGFASPTTGNADVNQGSVRGWIKYTVSSPNAPDPANLPSQQPTDPSPSTTAMLTDLFDGNMSIVGGGSYSFTYTLVDGAIYTQTG